MELDALRNQLSSAIASRTPIIESKTASKKLSTATLNAIRMDVTATLVKYGVDPSRDQVAADIIGALMLNLSRMG